MQQVSLGFDGNDLTAAVLKAEQILIAISGEDAFEEILKIILVKLYDEFLQQRGRGQPSLFSEAFQAPNTKDRLDALLLGATKEWAGVFDDAPGFKVASADLRHCMRPFLRVSLLAEEMLVLDATFEHLLGRTAKESMLFSVEIPRLGLGTSHFRLKAELRTEPQLVGSSASRRSEFRRVPWAGTQLHS